MSGSGGLASARKPGVQSAARGAASLRDRTCEELAAAVVAGDAAAWKTLVRQLGPAVLSFAESARPLGHRRRDADATHEVLTAVLERLRKDDFRALRTYFAWRGAPQNSERSLDDWLRIVTHRVACDYVTHRMRRRALQTLGVAIDTGIAWTPDGPGVTDCQAVRQILDHAERELPEEQAKAVRQIAEGKSITDISAALGEAREVVEKRLRAAYARLRRWVDDEREEQPRR